MAASLEIRSIDVGREGRPGLDALESDICRLLRCEPGRVASELQVEGYIVIRNAILRHIGGVRLVPPVAYHTVRFPGGGLVVALEVAGEECVATLRWDAPACTPEGAEAAHLAGRRQPAPGERC